MSVKRGYPESEDGHQDLHMESNGEASTQISPKPYTTYTHVHDALLSLKDVQSKSEIQLLVNQALLSIKASDLPSAVRQVAVRLAKQLCAYPETNTIAILIGLTQALTIAEPSARCEIYRALLALHQIKGVFALASIRSELMRQLESSVLSDLNHSQHHLRCTALCVLPLVKMHSKGGQNELFETISNYTADPHPKVRQTALNSLLHQHIMGAVLPVETYDDCVAATKDDFEQVRLVALELVWAISNAYPEYPVVIQKFKVSESIRLLDDAFVKICDMVNDCSVVVRQRACSILGRFKSVDSKFLSQTFSKQVMSHLRRFVPKGMMRGYGGRNRGVRSAHSKGFIPTPEGDTDVESEEFKLLDSGAAGAFVHGLEDEYQEVRDAAIESITELCTASADFSVKAVDFLVDMFNDSSDRVRLCAIRALIAIGGRSLIQLTEEQLSIAYSAMKDSSYHVREGIYKFLAVSTLARPEWLEHLMAGFRTNLEKYPEDQLEIYKTLKVLGLNHSQVITAPFVRTLLGISEHYLSREARIDDIVYAGNVILIMNTKPHMRKAIAMVLPDYVFSHLPYLKDKYPNSLPQDIIYTVPDKLHFVKQMLERPHPSLSIAQLTLEDGHKQLDAAFSAIQKLLDLVSGDDGGDEMEEYSELTAQNLAEFLARRVHEYNSLSCATGSGNIEPNEQERVVVRYAQLVSYVLQAQHMASKPIQQSKILTVASRIMYASYELDARTVGLDSDCRLALTFIRLFAHVVWLNAHILLQLDHRLADKMTGELLQRIRRAVRLSRAHISCHTKLSDTLQLLEEQWQRMSSSANGSGDAKQDMYAKFAQKLSSFVAQFKPIRFLPNSLCQRASARFLQAHTSKQAIEYNHVFPLNLFVNASLEWVAHRSAVAVSVVLPTRQTLLFCPPLNSIKPQLPMHWVLEWSEVPLSLPLSSGESTSVQLSISLQYPTDTPWSDSFVVAGNTVPSTYKVEEYFKQTGNPSQRHISVQIADKAHLISINPIEIRPLSSVHTRI